MNCIILSGHFTLLLYCSVLYEIIRIRIRCICKVASTRNSKWSGCHEEEQEILTLHNKHKHEHNSVRKEGTVNYIYTTRKTIHRYIDMHIQITVCLL